jgi:catechol 2,3-dioxygenase-like lactoylglutathione lyase family enzyme
MKGVKIIRTSNWDEMTTFYRDKLGMRERDHNKKDSLHEFADFQTEIHLERVGSEAEHELLGSLELYSSDPEGLASHLSKRGVAASKRVVGGQTELMCADPDGHVLTIVSESRRSP